MYGLGNACHQQNLLLYRIQKLTYITIFLETNKNIFPRLISRKNQDVESFQ